MGAGPRGKSGVITIDDIAAELNPQNVATRFDKTTFSTAASANIISKAVATVRASLPEKYRRMARCVSGLVLSREANPAVLTYSIPAIARVPDGARSHVWVGHRGRWGDRRVADAVTVTWGTDAVTLSAAPEYGVLIAADVWHTGVSAPTLLRRYALDLAVHDVVMALPSLCLDDSLRQSYSQRLDQTREDLREMSRGRLRLDEWDELELVDDQETVGVEGSGTWRIGW